MDALDRFGTLPFGGAVPIHDAPAVSPGKRTLTANLQRRSTAAPAVAPADPTTPAAATGAADHDPFWFATGPAVAGDGAALPHGDAIQRSFGRHDVGGIHAHVGGDAATAAAGLGAMAYATGDHVGFAAPPDLFTAAHEAAHVVQQRGGVSLRGLDGGDGDPFERHADEVAELVVQGRSSEEVLDRHAGSGDGAAPATVQRRRIFIAGGDGMSGMSLETENLSWDRLEEMLEDESLPMATRRDIMRAIDAGEVQGGYPGAYQYARDHLEFMHRFLPEMGEENEYTWIRRITGGGAGSLSGKRDANGIKTDMSEAEYDTCDELTTGFYDTAEELNLSRPRTEWLTLYRGFTVPESEEDNPHEDIEQRIAGFSDALPSSASWQREESIGMSAPGEGESAVLVYMAIPPDHPIVIMSYPNNRDPEHAPRHLDIGQAEVMVAASTYEDIEVFRVEKLAHGRVRYHVSVTLVARDRGEVMDGIATARQTADQNREEPARQRNIEVKDLKTVFGDKIGGELEADPHVDQVYVALDGTSWKFVMGDDHFGYDFTEE